MRKFTVFIIFSCLTLFSFSQKTSIFIEDKVYTGYVIQNFLNYDSFPKLSPAFINEFKVGHKTLGKKSWHQYYNYPEVGVSFLYGGLGNKRQFGNTFAIVPNISFNIKTYDKSSLKMSFGWGISHFNKPYDSIDNPHNILIGSKLTHSAYIVLQYQKYLGRNFYFDLAGAYLHSSNGHYQVPNGGMNLATLSVGVKKYFSPNNKFIEQNRPEKRAKSDIYLNLGYGIHEFAGTMRPVGTPKYDVYTLTLLYGKNYSYIGKYFIGFSGKYYKAFKYYIKKDSLYDKNIDLNSTIITFILGNEFQFGNFSIFVHGGLNIYTPFVRNFVYSDIYKYNINNILELFISTKLGMRYYLLNPQTSNFNIYTSWAIKANFGNADFTELSLGFVF